MRGKAAALDHAGVESGITPAYAGKSFSMRKKPFKGRDHPRLCGEKGETFRRFLRYDRITPAYAGKRQKN